MLRKQILLLGNKKCFCYGVKNIFACRTQILRPKHMFPSLATPGNITRNIVSATMFPSLTRPQGPHSVDCMATFYNAKVVKFFSRFWNPGSAGVDFFRSELGIRELPCSSASSAYR